MEASRSLPVVLVLVFLSDDHLAMLRQHFEVVYAADPAQRSAAIAAHAGTIHFVLTNGSTGFRADEIAALPELKMLSTLGVGYENVDLHAARQRSIALSNGAGTNAACVADHAMALLMAAVRRIVPLHQASLSATAREGVALSPNFSGKRMGILGMGQIGRQLARRAAGFDIEVAYHNRSRRDDIPYPWLATPGELAEWADYLVVATPGGKETHHLVNAELLRRLGPRGYLVNIGRGSVVDSAALGQALKDGTIAGAGLDVYEGEPVLGAALQDAPNLVASPHVAGWSPESIDNTVTNFIANVKAYRSGQPLLCPI